MRDLQRIWYFRTFHCVNSKNTLEVTQGIVRKYQILWKSRNEELKVLNALEVTHWRVESTWGFKLRHEEFDGIQCFISHVTNSSNSSSSKVLNALEISPRMVKRNSLKRNHLNRFYVHVISCILNVLSCTQFMKPCNITNLTKLLLC